MERRRFLKYLYILNFYYPESMSYLADSHWSTENILSTINQGIDNSISCLHYSWISYLLTWCNMDWKNEVSEIKNYFEFLLSWKHVLSYLGVCYQVENLFPVANLKNEKKLVLHVYYWDTIQEIIDITMTSSGKIKRTSNLEWFYWGCH